MYSHDTMGLGHFRRNLLIANELSKLSVSPNILLISGAREAEYFSLPPNVECLTLPSIYKEKDGRYRSRRLDMSLSQLIELRKKILQTTINSFEPDVLIVDGAPWGVEGELAPTLGNLFSQGHTRCVFGIRDVWDEPAVIHKEWNKRNNFDAIRKFYDEIWIYGDSSIYDPIQEYHLSPEVSAKVRHTGYLNQKVRLELLTYKNQIHVKEIFNSINGPFVLCLLGSGQDGGRLAKAFIDTKLPPGYNSVILTGPHMDPLTMEFLYRKAQKNPRIKIIEFFNEPTAILQKANYVVAMGGYNTICEILSFKKQALIVPRVKPRKEQLIRASIFEQRGFLDVLHPDELTPMKIMKWLKTKIGRPQNNYEFDMVGLLTISNLFLNLLNEKPFGTMKYKNRELTR